MDNQHRQIKGYRELSQEEIDLMNRVKAFGPELHKLVEDINTHISAQYVKSFEGLVPTPEGGTPEEDRLENANPCAWMEEGRVALQKGLMFLTRAIAQPGFF